MERFEHVPTFLRRFKWEHVMNAMLLLIALSMAGQTYFLHHTDVQNAKGLAKVSAQREADRIAGDAANKAQSNCLRDSIVSLTDTLQARAVPTEIERKATRRLIIGALGSPTPAEGEKLKRQYLRALRMADAIRDDNPVPDYPTGLCDGTSP